jgi:hypothetical protein
MNTMARVTMTFLAAAAFVISARGQDFVNLDFESAQNLPANPGIHGTSVATTSALPGWTAYDGNLALSEVYYGSNTLSYAANPELEGGSLALSGDFSVELYVDSSIGQTGLVPAGSDFLQFEAQGPNNPLPGPTGFSVTLGGQTLPYSLLSVGPDYSVYGANIPASLDGQVEALIFGCQGIGSGRVVLDNIEFSTTGVPEPGECAMLCAGVVLFGFRRRKRWV